jgi:serine protease Do
MIRIVLFTVLFLIPVQALAQNKQVPAGRSDIEYSYAPLVKKVKPAVVNIYTSRIVTQRMSPFMNDPFFEHFFGRSFGFGSIPRQRVENSLGSGTIVDPEGLVVTNAHVIKGADEITVVLPDGREFEASKLIVDEPSDLAVLKIKAQEPLPYIDLRPSENIEVGDIVLAIGNPFGVGQTVTSGIISAQARSSLNINDFNFFLQTDAAINPGNSGGPLIAMDGRIVGINTAIYSRDGGSLGIGFAIPSEMVSSVLNAAKTGANKDGRIIRPWLGIGVQEITPDIADSLYFDRPYGLLVSELHKMSPAKKAGMRVGDVVLSINGKELNEPEEMKFRMATVPLGDTARFNVLQNGREKVISVLAMAPPDDPPRNETELSGTHPLNGVKVANINPSVIAEIKGIREEEGVVVLQVSPRSQGARVVREGDVFLSVNGREIEDVSDLERALRSKSRLGLELVISRGGYRRQVILR